MKLEPKTLEVVSFELGRDPFSFAMSEPEAEPETDQAAASRYCTLIGTCTTCWNTRCNCA